MSDVAHRAVEPGGVGAAGTAAWPRWVLLALVASGVASSVRYTTMMRGIRHYGDDALSQTLSELPAWGVSTRGLWVVLGSVYDALVVAFGAGVWVSGPAVASRLRVVGVLLVAYGLLGVAWPFAAMQR